jgi:hypothetical protein
MKSVQASRGSSVVPSRSVSVVPSRGGSVLGSAAGSVAGSAAGSAATSPRGTHLPSIAGAQDASRHVHRRPGDVGADRSKLPSIANSQLTSAAGSSLASPGSTTASVSSGLDSTKQKSTHRTTRDAKKDDNTEIKGGRAGRQQAKEERERKKAEEERKKAEDEERRKIIKAQQEEIRRKREAEQAVQEAIDRRKRGAERLIKRTADSLAASKLLKEQVETSRSRAMEVAAQVLFVSFELCLAQVRIGVVNLRYLCRVPEPSAAQPGTTWAGGMDAPEP